MPEFFVARWHCRIPIARLFWWDMLLVGTAINGALTLAGLLAIANRLPDAAAHIAFALLLPYNLFMFIAVVRTSSRRRTPFAPLFQLTSLIWLVTFTLI
ncbi:MAG: hypothetical protein Q8M64_03445 [Methyloversatilis sp.]|nr:hypothetical protein [Methyloversatilis sp.]